MPKPPVVYFSREYTPHDRRFVESLSAEFAVHFLQLGPNRAPYKTGPLPHGSRRLRWEDGHAGTSSPDSSDRLRQLKGLLRRVGPVVVQSGPLDTCSTMIGHLDWHPSLVTSWGSDVLQMKPETGLSPSTVEYAVKRADAVLCDSKAVERKLRPLIPFGPDLLERFPWGVDLEKIHPDARARRDERKRLGWERHQIVLSARAWHPGYDTDVAVRAFALAAAKVAKLRLLLLGSGQLRKEISDLIETLGVADKVIRPGYVDEGQVLNAMQAADLYLCCTPTDGSSVTLLQAMAIGLPVTVTNNAGNREWVTQSRNGFLAEAGNIAGFAEAIAMVLDAGPQTRAEMGHLSRRRVEKNANWAENSERLLRLYARLAG